MEEEKNNGDKTDNQEIISKNQKNEEKFWFKKLEHFKLMAKAEKAVKLVENAVGMNKKSLPGEKH